MSGVGEEKVCEREGLEEERGVRGCGWGREGCDRVGLEEEKGCEGTGGVGLEKGKGWRKRGVWLEEERVGLEEEKGCEGTSGVGLEKGKGWRKRGCGWRKRRGVRELVE